MARNALGSRALDFLRHAPLILYILAFLSAQIIVVTSLLLQDTEHFRRSAYPVKNSTRGKLANFGQQTDVAKHVLFVPPNGKCKRAFQRMPPFYWSKCSCFPLSCSPSFPLSQSLLVAYSAGSPSAPACLFIPDMLDRFHISRSPSKFTRALLSRSCYRMDAFCGSNLYQ